MRKALILLLFLVQSASGGLVAQWKMNDNAASATVLDATGTYDGTYKDKDGNINTSTGDSPGFINGALSFDGKNESGGTDEWIDTGDPFQSIFQGDFSISIWVKPDDGQPAASGYIFGVSTGLETDCVWIVLANTGALIFQYTSDGNRGRFYGDGLVPVLSDGQETWHHIVIVVDSTIRAIGGVKGYIDGRRMSVGPLSKGDTTSVVSADYASTVNPSLGSENTDGGLTNEYVGLIDNVMLFDTALTQGKIDILNHGTEIVAELDDQISPRRGNLSRFPLRRRYEY